MSSLIPEKRVNKNGVAVTKHIRAEVSTKQKLILPAPAIFTNQAVISGAPTTVDEVRKLKMRLTNQLVESEDDFEEAADLHAVMRRSLRKPKSRNRKAKGWLVDNWHEERMPVYRFTHNKPVEYPWSKSARDMFFAGETTSKLVLEHNKPVSHLLEVLFAEVEKPDCTDQTFFDLLVKEHSGLNFAILTKAEDQQIDDKGLRYTHIESEDDLERYRRAEIDTSTLMALTEDPRFNSKTVKVGRSGKVTLRADRSTEI